MITQSKALLTPKTCDNRSVLIRRVFNHLSRVNMHLCQLCVHSVECLALEPNN